MMAFLNCKYSAGETRFAFRPGQCVRVGSSEWVELSLPNVNGLHDKHFSIDFCESMALRCYENLSVIHNGGPHTELRLTDGSEFLVGECVFQVSAPNLPSSFKNTASSTPDAEAGQTSEHARRTVQAAISSDSEAPAWFAEVDWKGLEIPAALVQSLQTCITPREALSSLAVSGQNPIALRIAAGLLKPLKCVSWSLGQIAGATHGSPLHAAAEQWLAQPNEDARLKVAELLPSADERPLEMPLEWLGQAIAWTGGSLAPADAPPVAPHPSLPAIACCTALLLHAALSESTLHASIEQAISILEGNDAASS